MENKIQRYIHALKSLGACDPAIAWLKGQAMYPDITPHTVWNNVPQSAWMLFMLRASTGFRVDAHIRIHNMVDALFGHGNDLVLGCCNYLPDDYTNVVDNVCRRMILDYYPDPPVLSLLEKAAARARANLKKQMARLREIELRRKLRKKAAKAKAKKS